jgi:predicted Zn-dependent peptidase
MRNEERGAGDEAATGWLLTHGLLRRRGRRPSPLAPPPILGEGNGSFTVERFPTQLRTLALVCWLVFGAAVPAQVAAQDPGTPDLTEPAEEEAEEPVREEIRHRLAVVTESGTPMVAVEVLLAAGPLDEDSEHAGITYLAARALVEPIRPALDDMGAYVSVHTYKDAVGFSLLAAPDAWEAASRTLLVALFRDPVDSLAIEREKRAIQAELEGRRANPADALSTEVDRAFWGANHPWGRPSVGSVESIQRIRLADVDDYLRQHFAPARTYVAVVGPVREDAAREHLQPFLGTESPVRPLAQGGLPEGTMLHRDYNSITTWVAASYRFGPYADLEALRLLAHLATEAISFGPRRPSVYNARSDVLVRAGEGEIRLQVVVPPREADDWADRVTDAVAQFAMRPLPPETFEQTTRSYRGSRLLALSSPEARARELARQVFLTGSVSPLIEFDQLTPQRLHLAARSLESPIVLLLGPTLRGE